jgi:hypothetical protein
MILHAQTPNHQLPLHVLILCAAASVMVLAPQRQTTHPHAHGPPAWLKRCQKAFAPEVVRPAAACEEKEIGT